MANTLLLKKSGSASEVPDANELTHGELALNYADGKIFFKNSSNAVSELISAPGTGAGQVLFSSAGASSINGDSTFFYNDSTNSLGIGTAAPDARLDIKDVYADSGSAVESLQLLIRGSQADLAPVGDSCGIGFGYSSADNYNKTGIINEFVAADGRSTLHLCTLSTQGADTITKADARLSIDNAGNVGIGVTDPDRKLHVEDSGGSVLALFEDTTQQSKLIKNGDQFVSDFFVNKGTSSESIAKFCKKIVDEHNEKME